MNEEPIDFSELVYRYQVLCIEISFWEPMDWHHPAIQQWLIHHGLDECKTPWQLPPAALWIMNQSLDRKLSDLKAHAHAAKIEGDKSTSLTRS
jgi:hypothetical protein